MPVQIRRAEAADAAAIAAVHVSGWEGAYRGMVPDEALDRRTVARQTELWDQLLGGIGDPLEESRPWVAVAQPEGHGERTPVIGFVALNIPSRDAGADPRTAEVSALYVEPSGWRRGTGGGLMDAALAEATSRDCAEVTLWVLETNRRARAFYERCGFLDDGARQPAGDGWPMELRMRRAL